ncbi:hypothetical protein D3C73_1628190 [compost metagenome]
MIAAQLLEQFQAASVRQHYVQHHGGRGGLRQCATGALAIVAGAHMESFLAQPAAQELAQLLVIIN